MKSSAGQQLSSESEHLTSRIYRSIRRLVGPVGSGDNNANGNKLMAFAIRMQLTRKYLID